MTGRTGGGGEGAGLGELRRAGGTHASAFERATVAQSRQLALLLADPR